MHFPSFPSPQTDSLLDTLIKILPQFKGTIGTVYCVLNTSNLEQLIVLKSKWEEELDTDSLEI